MLGVLLVEICILIVLINHVIAFPLPLLVRRFYASSYDFIPVVAAGTCILPIACIINIS